MPDQELGAPPEQVLQQFRRLHACTASPTAMHSCAKTGPASMALTVKATLTPVSFTPSCTTPCCPEHPASKAHLVVSLHYGKHITMLVRICLAAQYAQQCLDAGLQVLTSLELSLLPASTTQACVQVHGA